MREDCFAPIFQSLGLDRHDSKICRPDYNGLPSLSALVDVAVPESLKSCPGDNQNGGPKNSERPAVAISSSPAESAANSLLDARMNKKRQMRWSPIDAYRGLAGPSRHRGRSSQAG